MINAVARRVGIPGKDKVQWGEHLCAFFNTRTDLLNLVAPYIKAGLEDNEFCLWITEDNMEQEAMETLQRLLPEAPQYVSRKQLEVLQRLTGISTLVCSTRESPSGTRQRVEAQQKRMVLSAHGRQELRSGFSRKKIGASSYCMNRPFIKRLKLNV